MTSLKEFISLLSWWGMKSTPVEYRIAGTGILYYKKLGNPPKDIPKNWIRKGIDFWLLKSAPKSLKYLIVGTKDKKVCIICPRLGGYQEMFTDSLSRHYLYGRGISICGPSIHFGGATRTDEQNVQELMDAIFQNEHH